MSKSLKKLIDINRLREFKNKLVGAGSAYVQTAAVDQTIAGTKTFSKPVVGSVTGSSGSCTGNAASATKLQTARTINGTSFNGSANITTANWGTARNITITDGTNTSTAVSVNGSANVSLTLPATIKADLTGNAATATKAAQDAAGNTIATTYATKAENNTKANNSEVVHKSGDETIAGTKTFSNGVLSTAVNAFMAQAGGYTVLLRNDGRDTYLLMSDKDGAPGTYSSARPFRINNATGVCDINGNASSATKATGNANGKELTNTIIKGLSISGKTITYTQIDGTTGTLTTQDTNTDTLMTQNVSTTNATYPVLLVATADATANQGAKTGIFAKSVKVNPSTNVISASGFSGPLTGNVTGNCSGSSGSCTGNAATATQFSANTTVALTGDATGTSAGSKKGWSVPVTLANSGVTAGTYGPSADVTGNNNATISVPEITVDAKGRVTSVTNRTLTCKNNTYSVYNKTLTIQKNGTNVATFTSNSNTDVTANITVPTKTSQLTNDSGFLTSHQSLSNYVTLNGAQTISGAKTFTGNIIGINKDNSTENANSLYSTTAGSKLTYYTTSNGGTTLTNVPAAVNTTLESRTIRRLSDSDWVVEQICHNSTGLYYRKGSNGTWGAWKTFAFTDSNISGNAATATTATTAKACTGNAATATKLAAKRTIALSGAATGTATDFDGSGNITIPVTALSSSAIRAQWYAAYPDGAEAHNAMWGGRDITAAFDAGTVSEHIADGTFKDIFPGDYITKQVTISGTAYTVNWVVADCDYWINKGDQGNGMETHHVVIVPQAPIFNANMNAANTTEGGYAGSRMYRETIPACATGIVNAFGASHILTFRDGISDSVDTSHVSSGIPQWTGTPDWWGEWASVQCNLMSEKMVYGAPICAAGAMDNTMATRQMSAFRLSEKLINYNRQPWWLRDVVSSAIFAFVGGGGSASTDYASTSFGVRPFALLK